MQQQKEIKELKQSQEKREAPKDSGLFTQSSYQKSPAENQKKATPQPTNDSRNKGFSPPTNKSNHEIEEDQKEHPKRPSDQDPKIRHSPLQQQKQPEQPKIQVTQAPNTKPEQQKRPEEPRRIEEPKIAEQKLPQQTKPVQQQQQTKPVAKIPRVNTSDVALIASELNLRFRLHRLAFHELEYVRKTLQQSDYNFFTKHLATEAGVGSEDELNIKQLTDLLQR